MTDHLDFEARLGERLRARGAMASRPFDAAEIAHQAVVADGRSRGNRGLGWPSTHPADARRRTLMVTAALFIALVLAVGAVVGARLTSVQPAPPDLVPRPAAWIATDPMSEARRDHTATLLPDGRVLVAGGDKNSDERLASAELYDPGSRSWTATGPMIEARSGHRATLLPDGRVLVTGEGRSTELYDPAAGSWAAAAPMSERHALGTATLLPDGTVLVVGGIGGAAQESGVEVYDPRTGVWTPAPGMIEPRYNHATIVLHDGRVLVVGGDEVPDVGVVTAELYDPDTRSWTATGSLQVVPHTHAATLLPDGRVLVAGAGRGTRVTAELYDPATGSWTPIAGPIPNVAGGNGGIVLLDGTVLFVDDEGVVLYDPASGRWMDAPRKIENGGGGTFTRLSDGTVLAAGGVGNLGASGEYDQLFPLASAQLYDPGSGPR